MINRNKIIVIMMRRIDLYQKIIWNMTNAEKYTYFILKPKISINFKINLNISLIIYLIITPNQILYNYDQYSYNIQKTFITCFTYIK